MTPDLLASLLAPIAPANPAGDDISYSQRFDDIREARRADDPLLEQGDWETTIKTAEWAKAKQLSEQALLSHSKDFQLAAWYTEAQTRLHGFAGAAFGFQVLNGLLEQYWERAYPAFDPHDLEERVSKFEWLNKQLPQALKQTPLTAREHGAHHWYAWEQSRAVDNLGLKDPEARDKAVRDGKISGETFDKAVAASGAAFYVQLTQELRAASAAFDTLDAAIGRQFGAEAPGLREIRHSLADCSDIAERLLQKLGGAPQTVAAPAVSEPTPPAPHEASMPHAPFSVQLLPSAPHHPAIPSLQPPRIVSGPIKDRQEAVQRLREVADYFRMYEPHSPVAHLAERTAKWANMSLEQWLGSVIKDEGTLGQLRELLDVNSAP